ncbi:ABC transporter [Halobacillus sp. BAB-2008]|nr:ABC transporter [Halobacillus sp. BAB-2008]
MITMEKVVKSFKQKTALNELDVQVSKGEIFGFLGPSGSGKTTTIKILTGQMAPDQGSARVFGIDSIKIKEPQHLRNIGIMTDNSSLYERLSVWENLKLYCKLYDIPLKRVEEVLSIVGLTGTDKETVAGLSKGMKQRILLARAILHEPKLLFLDEPTGALDPLNTRHIHEGLRTLRDNGATIFLTTHDMEEAESLCDRVAFLSDGRVKEIGRPDVLRRKYSDSTLVLELTNGTQIQLDHTKDSAKEVFHYMHTEQVASIHTKEPSLGDVFMTVTGRHLV